MQELLERLVFLQQFGNLLSRELSGQIADLFDAIVGDIYRYDPVSVQRRYREARRVTLMERTGGRVQEWRTGLERHTKGRLAVLGRQQAAVAERSLIATLGTVDLEDRVRETPITQARMRAILNTQPFEGRVLREHVAKLGENVVDRVGVQVRLGMAREESIDDIVRRVRGRRAGNGFVGGAMQTTTRDAESLVRTAVTFTANQGMLGTFRANDTVIAGVRFVATLDDRTTLICFSLDGDEWELDDADLVIPGEATHFGCRSILVAIIDWEGLGLPEPPPADRIARDLSELTEEQLGQRIRTRRSKGELGRVTRVSSNTAAATWLRSQPVRVQERIMGRRRAELFRAGELSVKQMVTRDLRVLSLEELVA